MAMLRQQLRLMFLALQFFTRLPIPRWVGFDAAWLPHATRYFPLVGLALGVWVSALYALASLALPAPLAILLSTAAGIYLSGALHEDGFADVCDGLGGGATAERALAIMKDSSIGAYGAVGIGLLLAVKCLTLDSLPPYAVVAALLLAHPLSRLCACALIWRLDYVRVGQSKARALAQQMSGLEFFIAALPPTFIALALGAARVLPWSALTSALVAALLATLWLTRKLLRRLGGYTGDCLGAVQQISEVAIYLGLLAWLRHGAL